jgi:aminopeptidase
MGSLAFEQKLQRYADLTVQVGLNLQPGQRLIVIAHVLDVAPLARQIAASAYQQGCPLVGVLYLDEQLNKTRYQHAPRDSFEEYPSWMTAGVLQCLERGDAYLQIGGLDPELLSTADPELKAIAGRVTAQNYRPIMEKQLGGNLQWSYITPPTPGWATRVFPGVPAEEAVARLWEAVFAVCRLDEPAPIAFWHQYLAGLRQRSAYLTAKQYASLHFTAPCTDLRLDLPAGHIWSGAGFETRAGVPFVANLPTEEVFTIPHKDGARGTVRATKPLNFRGSLIDEFEFTFEAGKVVDFSAGRGEDALRNILTIDENMARLGEVALVPHQSPISQSGIVFQATLYDENASCHLALGSAPKMSIQDGGEMSDEEFAAAGGNVSMSHVDFMFGSGEMDVDGLRSDGLAEPVLRGGEWAFVV